MLLNFQTTLFRLPLLKITLRLKNVEPFVALKDYDPQAMLSAYYKIEAMYTLHSKQFWTANGYKSAHATGCAL